MIRKAKKNDINYIYELSKKTKTEMLKQGLNQWVGDYPLFDNFKNDYLKSGLYVYIENERIIASISILEENDPPYKEIEWDHNHSLVIHRLLVDPDYQKSGIGKKMFEKAIELTKEKYLSLKVDTHPDNLKMQNLITKMGFQYKGYIESINRLAYELIV
ncbi:GNAT family N-acetyltransferase [Mycoplasmatota bacterium]|nr:GNAT family N-acetyltransferase [Mycoplasmatota bacterium]